MVKSEDDEIYGWELIIDLQSCDVSLFNRETIDKFFSGLCRLIEMQKCEVHFWDDLDVPEEERQTLPHTKGTSAVCFILTSTIVVHTLDLLGSVYVNIFSCKDFDKREAVAFSAAFFNGEIAGSTIVPRVTGGQRNAD